MRYRRLGRSPFTVSRLCFGTIPLGIGGRMAPARAVSLLKAAFSTGVNFVDSAETYGTQELVGRAAWGRDDVVVATKSYAPTYEGMDDSLRRALFELGRKRIELFLLHEQESVLTLAGHEPALVRLVEARAQGIVGAIGLSTHRVAGVRAAMGDDRIEVIHAITNHTGMGIADGDIGDMLSVLASASRTGRGIYGMKALGGGHLLSDAQAALRWVFGLSFVDAVAVGIGSRSELSMNSRIASGLFVPVSLTRRSKSRMRSLDIEEHCMGCGDCVAACPQAALSVCEGRAVVNPGLCLRCGYCVARCPELALKLM